MKKLFNSMKRKSNEMAINAVMIKERAKLALSNNRGEGYLDVVIRLLLAVVLGALLLAALYALFNDVVLPRLETEVTEMFDYKG